MSDVNVKTEKVGDIPLLVKQQQQMGIDQIIDNILPRHGNRQGLSLGQMIMGWLAYMVSAQDHRLSFVEDWAGEQEIMLSQLFGQPVSRADFTDDRLGDCLLQLSDDKNWCKIEKELGQKIINVYQLTGKTVRVDATTVTVYHDDEGSHLVGAGYSKEHRPDLNQIKVMMSSLDPVSLPIATAVVGGEKADDGLYVPIISSSQAVIGQGGYLYVGDSKMSALSTRAYIAQSGDYYLTPLSKKGKFGQLLRERVDQVLSHEAELIEIADPKGETVSENAFARAGATEIEQSAWVADSFHQWPERHCLIWTATLAQSQERGLKKRLAKATQKLLALTPEPGRGKRQQQELKPLQAKVKRILKSHKVVDLLTVSYEEQVQQKPIRAYKDKPARTETTIRYQLHVHPNEEAIAQEYRYCGWRLYVTNAPDSQLDLADLLFLYRDSVPTIERSFSRLKGRPLGLRPLWVHRDDHICGLVRLLSLALRLLNLIEFVVRRSLDNDTEPPLTGLYPGNPNRSTDRPTVTQLLRVFKSITLSIIDLPGQHIVHVTPLTILQCRILKLLRFSDDIFISLADKPPNSS